MNRLWVAALVSAGVLVAGLVVRAYVTRKGGEFLSPGSRHTLTGFVLLTAVLVGLAALAVALNPATTDTVVVSLVRSLPGLFLAGVIVILSVLLGRFAAALAMALGFGLGAVPLARQVAAGRHVSDRFRVADDHYRRDARPHRRGGIGFYPYRTSRWSFGGDPQPVLPGTSGGDGRSGMKLAIVGAGRMGAVHAGSGASPLPTNGN